MPIVLFELRGQSRLPILIGRRFRLASHAGRVRLLLDDFGGKSGAVEAKAHDALLRRKTGVAIEANRTPHALQKIGSSLRHVDEGELTHC